MQKKELKGVEVLTDESGSLKEGGVVEDEG